MPRNRRKLVEPGEESPLDFAVSQRERDTLSMVRRALSAGDVALAFQPVVQAAPGNPVAYYEGLIRLFDETGRVIPAADFMGTVEDKDLGRQIDCVALSLGLKTLRANPGIRLAVNMSARSIGYQKWMNILRKFIRLHPHAVERLVLEITESSAMSMPEIVTTFMEDMQSKGMTFALDDFGAGFTALRYFKDFCFDILKIDGQFIRGVDADADNQVVTAALLAIARQFDMLAVAEAVESADEALWLSRAGLDCMQGYFFAAPSLQPPWKRPMEAAARRA